MRFHFIVAALCCGLVAGCDCNGNNPDNDGGTGGGAAAGEGGGTGGSTAGGTGGASGGGTGGAGGGGVVLADGGISTCIALQSCESYNNGTGANCGLLSDGCGDLINCGTCDLPQTCGGGGVPSRCGGSSGCVPKTCAELGYDCGPASDQCGALISCGSCLLPEVCGGGGTPGVCGLLGSNLDDAGVCIKTTCAQVGAACGTISDGCGGTVDCGGCGAGEGCGLGGVPFQCGSNVACTPLTCMQAGATCGLIGDGCGNTINCGDPATVCEAWQTCGGGGVPNVCGGGQQCMPIAEGVACAGKCGVVGNGCGNGTYNCGDNCAATGQTCGGGGVANVCGGPASVCPGGPPPAATVCNNAGKNCGTISDGCGGTVNCGTCSGGQTCGGGGTENVCGACVPRTCADLGKDCGVIPNGCGGLTASCGTCTAPDICGGAGTPNVCGAVLPDAGTTCPLCMAQGGPNTRITGTVLAPTVETGSITADPIPNALVYIPTQPLDSLDGQLPDGGVTNQVTCDRCIDGVSGQPLVSTTSAINGTFTLENTPCGIDVPVVIQLGKWRRKVTIPSPACNVTTTLTRAQSRLAREQGEGGVPENNIPRIAVVTGSVDAIECVLPKIGIAASQFSLPTGNGRVKFYRDNGANFTGGTTSPGNGNYGAAQLYDNLSEMRKYDMIIFDCVASEVRKTVARRTNLENYVNAGGRVFASHFAYAWLFPIASNSNPHNFSLSSTATWNAGQSSPPNQDARIDTSFPKGADFAQWVHLPEVNAQATTSTLADPRIRINVVRRDMNAVSTTLAQRWVHGAGANNNPTSGVPFQFTFNTPTTAQPINQCGRVLFSDFHVRDGSFSGSTWPNHCSATALSPQEKVFEYLIFDLSSCVQPDQPVEQMCTPLTCADLPGVCGPQSNGCGGTIANCSCPGGQTCVNGSTCCTPLTCAQAGANCGQVPNGCGGLTANCGSCSGGQTCGGGGTPNVCGGGTCQPLTCGALGYNCGQWGNGCGGVTASCGTCPTGQTCGGGGVEGQCGGGMCVAKTCQEQGFQCGTQGNGCGQTQDCGMCPPGQVCGAAGPGICGDPPACTGQTCQQLGLACGVADDGCGTPIDCGMCPPGQVCGAAGPGQCGVASCNPLSCADQGIACGQAGDGCGNIIACPVCPEGQTCGGGGVPGQCGTPSCTPLTCAQQGFNCGAAGNGCGGIIDCGQCSPPKTCGGGGVPNVCGSFN